MSRYSDIFYKACELNNPETGQPSGVFHFCAIHGTGARQAVYPVGYCRGQLGPNKEVIRPKCKHKTAQQANDCFRKFELEKMCVKHNKPDGDVYKCQFPGCEVHSSGLVTIGVRPYELHLCEKHQDDKVIAKLYPRYEVVQEK